MHRPFMGWGSVESRGVYRVWVKPNPSPGFWSNQNIAFAFPLAPDSKTSHRSRPATVAPPASRGTRGRMRTTTLTPVGTDRVWTMPRWRDGALQKRKLRAKGRKGLGADQSRCTSGTVGCWGIGFSGGLGALSPFLRFTHSQHFGSHPQPPRDLAI